MHKIPTLEEIKKSRKPIPNANTIHNGNLSLIDKFALFITNHVGTMGFFFIIFLWTISWLSWNTLGPDNLRFDPVPGFVLWLFISNMIQIFLMPLILIGQNLQDRYNDARSEAAYEVNLRSEYEVEVILMHLENLEKAFKEQEEKIAKLSK